MTTAPGQDLTSPMSAACGQDSNRWVGVGTFSSQDPEQAVAEALAPILALVHQAIGDGEVIGCSSAGELIRDHALSGGLVILGSGR